MNKAAPTQGTRHLLISKSHPPSRNVSIRELWLNRLPLCLRSSGLSDTCQHQQTRLAGWSWLTSPGWGCFKHSSVLRSSIPLLRKIQSSAHCNSYGLHKQIDVCLHNSSPERPQQFCVCKVEWDVLLHLPHWSALSWEGTRGTQHGEAQQAALGVRVWGWQKEIETPSSNRVSRCPAAFRSVLDNDQESDVLERKRSSITLMQAWKGCYSICEIPLDLHGDKME